ncbi:hypothetical protein BH11MYX3_BH11MYX3_18930 [soil metagenome]
MSRRETPWLRLGVVAGVAALIVAVVFIVRGGHTVPDDVQRIEWNRQACAHCQMLIGDPHHAAQLITDDGDALSFDDPGCALRYLDQHQPRVHRLWFHDSVADRWLPADEVGFVTGGTTPMGSGLLAVERGTRGAIDLAAARRLAPVGVPMQEGSR